MANNIIKTIVANGSKSIILHIYMESDGNEGELVNYPLFDPMDDLPEFTINKFGRITVRQVWYSLSWFDGLLTFDDLIPAPSWNLVRDGPGYFDFRYFGGIKERYTSPQDMDSSDRTGKVLITTTDFAPLGSVGTMVLELWKGQE